MKKYVVIEERVYTRDGVLSVHDNLEEAEQTLVSLSGAYNPKILVFENGERTGETIGYYDTVNKMRYLNPYAGEGIEINLFDDPEDEYVGTAIKDGEEYRVRLCGSNSLMFDMYEVNVVYAIKDDEKKIVAYTDRLMYFMLKPNRLADAEYVVAYGDDQNHTDDYHVTFNK
ncbi:hypothetical protein CAI16_05500 [Virgibacillus dokdonensis]|uniref:Uncharacterized protein n=1 Tax=Virgibacillus dokdonensis TaxID=302167 RepID=A0A3E0WTE8_9BACI|nr:hypothetical protein [Virgibacillus dokdonensis]RFA36244.1 hypothetical protein CAI16_05500 [Virgibacillus dokdonensis]